MGQALPAAAARRGRQDRLSRVSNMRTNVTRVLVVEDDPDDSGLIQEAIAEVHEGRYHAPWAAALEAVAVQTLEEALVMLASERFDAVLLDLFLPDSAGLATYLTLRNAAGDLPVIVLSDSDEETLAASAVREGAQDYLVKTEIDCSPLARSLRYAIERQRLTLALRRISLVDEFTGLYSMTGFFTLAAHDLELARKLGADFCVMIAEPDPGGDPALAQLDAADRLRLDFPPTAVVGRLAGGRFAVAAAGLRADALPALPFACGAADLDGAPSATVDDLLTIAERKLCENSAGGKPSPAPRPSVWMQPTA